MNTKMKSPVIAFSRRLGAVACHARTLRGFSSVGRCHTATTPAAATTTTRTLQRRTPSWLGNAGAAAATRLPTPRCLVTPSPCSAATSFVSSSSSSSAVLFQRSFASMSSDEIQKRLDGFQDLFVEARLCIEDATESAGTSYFEEDAQAATEAVNEAVAAFEQLVNDVDDDDEKNRILRGNGLKVEQLKGELEMALHGGSDH